MLKKSKILLVAFLLSILLFSNINTENVYAAEPCQHPSLKWDGTYYNSSWHDYNGFCTQDRYKRYACTTTGCYYSTYIQYETYAQAHSITTVDGGHSGANKHLFKNVCSRCGYLKSSFTNTCSGPPCTIPY